MKTVVLRVQLMAACRSLDCGIILPGISRSNTQKRSKLVSNIIENFILIPFVINNDFRLFNYLVIPFDSIAHMETCCIYYAYPHLVFFFVLFLVFV